MSRPRTPLVVVLSARTAEHVRTLVDVGWDGPVLLVGSVSEAQQVIGAPQGASAREGTGARVEALPAGRVSAAPKPADPTPRDSAALRLDVDRQQVVCGPATQGLTPLEFGVLEALLCAPGRVHRYAELTRRVWGTHYTGDAASLHAVVRRLRRKLHDVRAPLELEAVRGIGFRLGRAEPSATALSRTDGVAAVGG